MTRDLEENIPKSPMMYELDISRDLRDVSECMCLESPIEECEKNLMRKLDEVYSLYNSTKDNRYKEVLLNLGKRYNKILTRNYSKSSELISLENLNFVEDLNKIHPEEMEEEILMWRKAFEIID